MTVRVSLFWLPVAVSSASPTCSPCTTAFGCCRSQHRPRVNHSPVRFRLPVLSQYHPPAWLAVPEQHRFAPPRSLRKRFLRSDESLGKFQGDPAVPCFRFVLLKVAAPHLSVQMGSRHGRYVYCGICHSKRSSLGTTLSCWCRRTCSWSQEYPLLQRPRSKGG